MLIISAIFGIISLLLLCVAFVTLASKKEGSLKKGVRELMLAFLTTLFSIYISSFVNFAAENFFVGIDSTIISTGADFESVGSSVSNTESTMSSNNTPEGLGTTSEDPVHYHTIYSIVAENGIDASCIDSGSYDSVAYCICGIELSRETVVTSPLGHKYLSNKKEPSCINEGFTTYICSTCEATYVDDYTKELGHDYSEGVCVRCGQEDPDYTKEYTGENIMQSLSSSVVTSSGTYKDYLGNDSISVFAEDQYNCFSINTAVSYNLWGGNVQSVIFNISKLNDIDTLAFDIGGESGSSGSMEVEFFINKTFDEDADCVYNIEASAIPTHALIQIKDAISLGIRVTNHSDNQNRLVFFNFSDGNS